MEWYGYSGWMDRLDWGVWPSTGPLRSMDLMECRPSFQARQRIQYDLDTAGSLYGSHSACAEKCWKARWEFYNIGIYWDNFKNVPGFLGVLCLIHDFGDPFVANVWPSGPAGGALNNNGGFWLRHASANIRWRLPPKGLELAAFPCENPGCLLCNFTQDQEGK